VRLSNDKALHALCQALSSSVFARISNCKSAQEAWQILEKTYEGTKLVKSAKLQVLISRFEEIKMLEDETFGEFYTRIRDLRNSMVSLRKMIYAVKLIWKILGSLPECFRIKVTTIEESKDLESMKIEELVGSLQLMSIPYLQSRKQKQFPSRHLERWLESHLRKTIIMKKMQWQCWPRNSRDWWRMRNSRRSSLKDCRRPLENLNQKKLRRRIQEVPDVLSAQALGIFGLIVGTSSRLKGRPTTLL
jgi:hypothetical protein